MTGAALSAPDPFAARRASLTSVEQYQTGTRYRTFDRGHRRDVDDLPCLKAFYRGGTERGRCRQLGDRPPQQRSGCTTLIRRYHHDLFSIRKRLRATIITDTD